MDDNDDNDAADVVNPVAKIHAAWMKMKGSADGDAEKQFDIDSIEEVFQYINHLIDSAEGCVSFNHPEAASTCSCLKNLLDSIRWQKTQGRLRGGAYWIAFKLVDFAKKTHNDQRDLLSSWIRYSQAVAKEIAGRDAKKLSYILPGMEGLMICQFALCKLLGIGRSAFRSNISLAKSRLKSSHGSEEKEGGGNRESGNGCSYQCLS